MNIIKKDLLQELTKRDAIRWKDNYIILLNTINLTLFPARAWAVTLQNLGVEKGADYIFELGFIYGQSAFKILDSKIKSVSSNLPKEYQSFIAYLELAGIGKVKKFKEKNAEMEFDEHYCLDYANQLYNKNAYAPFFYAGVITSFYNSFFNKKIKFKFNQKNNIYAFSI